MHGKYEKMMDVQFHQIARSLPLIIDLDTTRSIYEAEGSVFDDAEYMRLKTIEPVTYNNQKMDIHGFKPMLFKFSNGARHIAVYKILEMGMVLMILLPKSSSKLEHHDDNYLEYIKTTIKDERVLTQAEEQYKAYYSETMISTIEEVVPIAVKVQQQLKEWREQLSIIAGAGSLKNLGILWDIAYSRDRVSKTEDALPLMDEARDHIFNYLSLPYVFIRIEEHGRVMLKSGEMYRYLGTLRPEEYMPLIAYLCEKHPHCNKILADSIDRVPIGSEIETWFFKQLLTLRLPSDDWLKKIIKKFSNRVDSNVALDALKAKMDTEGRSAPELFFEASVAETAALCPLPDAAAAAYAVSDTSAPRHTSKKDASVHLTKQGFLEELLPITEDTKEGASRRKTSTAKKGLTKAAEERLTAIISEHRSYINPKFIVSLCIRLMQHFDRLKERFAAVFPLLVHIAKIDLTMLSFEAEQAYFYQAVEAHLNKGHANISMLAHAIDQWNFADTQRKFRDSIMHALKKEPRAPQPSSSINHPYCWLALPEKIDDFLNPKHIVSVFEKWGDKGKELRFYITQSLETNRLESLSCEVISALVALMMGALPARPTGAMPEDKPLDAAASSKFLSLADEKKHVEQADKIGKLIMTASRKESEPLNLLSLFVIVVCSLHGMTQKTPKDVPLNRLGRRYLEMTPWFVSFFQHCVEVFITSGIDPSICPVIQDGEDKQHLIMLCKGLNTPSLYEMMRADFGFMECLSHPFPVAYPPKDIRFLNTCAKALLTYSQQILRYGYNNIVVSHSYDEVDIPNAKFYAPTQQWAAKIFLAVGLLYILKQYHQHDPLMDEAFNSEFSQTIHELLFLSLTQFEMDEIPHLFQGLYPYLGSNSFHQHLERSKHDCSLDFTRRAIKKFFEEYVSPNYCRLYYKLDSRFGFGSVGVMGLEESMSSEGAGTETTSTGDVPSSYSLVGRFFEPQPETAELDKGSASAVVPKAPT